MVEPIQLKLKIHGMHCEACVRRVTASLNSLPGLRVEKVEVGEADLTYDPSMVDPDRISAAIGDAGFDIAN